MTLSSDYLASKHAAGLTYEKFLQAGTAQQAENWRRNHEQAKLTEAQRTLARSFTRRMSVIVLAGIWCGDCAQQCTLVQRIAEANPGKIDVKWLDRDQHPDLQKQVRINGGDRVPVVLFCAEDHELVCWFGDKPLSRYRAMAKQQLGVSCPLPGAVAPGEEIAAMLQDWLDQFERVHLVLRLSARLRKKHGD